MNSNEVIKKLQIKNGKLQVQIERLKLDKEEYYLDYLDLQQRINKAIEYCEEITRKEIDTSDTDFELGQDFTARDILNILKKEE